MSLNFPRHKSANYQDLLKFIALILMIIDHIGMILIEPQFYPIISSAWLRVVGRFSMPIFCFFVGYNYSNTKQKTKIRNILIIGILLQYLNIYLIGIFFPFNILVTIVIGLLVLDCLIMIKFSLYLAALLLAFVWPFAANYFDYGTLGFSFIIAGYIFKNSNRISISILLMLICYSNAVFNEIIFHFSDIQNYCSYFISLMVFLLLIINNFSREINYKFLLLTRYMLEIYFIHYLALMLIYSIYIVV